MASKNLYVGNLPFTTTQADLEQLFGNYGTVTKTQVVSDRETGRSRGFGFVEMSSGADEAIAALNNAEYQGRRLTVNEAKPREERPRGGGGGGYGGGGGGYGGGGGGYGGGGGGGRRGGGGGYGGGGGGYGGGGGRGDRY
ncbi:RNA recognition motif domain-containing protein [Gemmata algarum]|uniref:RNA recognition motif domain-containing protein n=1 Tax=Gemmata algarum TaxID=2975278 RepID=UPI0039C98F33